MKLLKIAVDLRLSQLTRQIKEQKNPMIQEILETEKKELQKEFETYTTKQK